MTYYETEILIQKYLNGETTAEEERMLALEVSREDAPEDWKIIAEMLGELTVDEALFDKIMAERKHKPHSIRLWSWVAAACVAALLIVFLGPPREETSTQPQVAKVEPKKHYRENVMPEQQVTEYQNQPEKTIEPIADPMDEINDIAQVEEPAIQDSRKDFMEYTRSIRERGELVMQRIAALSAGSAIN